MQGLSLYHSLPVTAYTVRQNYDLVVCNPQASLFQHAHAEPAILLACWATAHLLQMTVQASKQRRSRCLS
jgi:hypothetical protein